LAKFKTRARAVDLLGRQQIAGIPTAVSELFKNAHDAYASHVEVDYFRTNRLFILRDDGLGMTRKDFEERWLTIGTESKLLSGNILGVPPKDPNMKSRPIMGEKGIGRLSIAIIGNQVLILTRAERNGKLGNCIAAFIHWGIFSIPGINLEDIEIPITEYQLNELPTQYDISEMVKIVQNNVKSFEQKINKELFTNITNDLKKFVIDPKNIYEGLKGPTLLNGRGTHFFIKPADETLSLDLDSDLNGKGISRIKKLLLGFSNLLNKDPKDIPIKPAFRYWKNDKDPKDVIGSNEFFTKEDYEKADHHIKGIFDQTGKFSGKVSIYGEEKSNYELPWIKSKGKKTSCGSFSVNISYLMGKPSESKLPKEEYNRLKNKLNLIGGIYIYRDGIRILPYGDSDVDFLNIEKRRTKGMSYYFFSYRRIYGTIEITAKANSKLVEKAGREGFQENKAYREFREIIENLLIQLAADYFRTEGKYSSVYIEGKEKIRRVEKAKKEIEKKRTLQRRDLNKKLEGFFTHINNDLPIRQSNEIVEKLITDLEKIRQEKQPELIILGLFKAEKTAKNALSNLRKMYIVDYPKSLGLTKELRRDWQRYQDEFKSLEETILTPIEDQIIKK